MNNFKTIAIKTNQKETGYITINADTADAINAMLGQPREVSAEHLNEVYKCICKDGLFPEARAIINLTTGKFVDANTRILAAMRAVKDGYFTELTIDYIGLNNADAIRASITANAGGRGIKEDDKFIPFTNHLGEALTDNQYKQMRIQWKHAMRIVDDMKKISRRNEQEVNAYLASNSKRVVSFSANAYRMYAEFGYTSIEVRPMAHLLAGMVLGMQKDTEITEQFVFDGSRGTLAADESGRVELTKRLLQVHA